MADREKIEIADTAKAIKRPWSTPLVIESVLANTEKTSSPAEAPYFAVGPS